MRTLVILGNGFDLDLGWKTSYNHFFNSYWGNCTKQWIPDLQERDNWCDLEGYLRQRTINLTNDGIDVERLWRDWLRCKSNIWEYFNQGKETGVFDTKTDSCAYHLLRKIKNADIISFNYTEPQYYTDNSFLDIPIKHIHGSLYDGLTGSNMRLGIDSLVECKYLSADKIKPLLKSVNNNLTSYFLKSMKEVSTIIVFGHSFGITDSDYFKPLLERMSNNIIKDKTLFIITRDASTMEIIKNNMSTYGIIYNNLILSDNDIREIHTDKTYDNIDFQEMLSLI